MTKKSGGGGEENGAGKREILKKYFLLLVSFHQSFVNSLNPSVRINGSLFFSMHPNTGFNTVQPAVGQRE